MSRQVERGNAYVDFLDNWGQIVEIDQTKGVVSHSVHAHSGVLFDGFTSFELSADGSTLMGVTPHVEQQGSWCSDGCFQVGTLEL